MFRLAELGKKLAPLSEASHLVYWELLENADWRMGRVLMTHAQMADKIGKSVRTIERATRELTEAELINHKKGMFAINPEFAWGGRSWNIPKATYHTLNGKTAHVISFADASEAKELLEKAGRETLREITARKTKGIKTC